MRPERRKRTSPPTDGRVGRRVGSENQDPLRQRENRVDMLSVSLPWRDPLTRVSSGRRFRPEKSPTNNSGPRLCRGTRTVTPESREPQSTWVESTQGPHSREGWE